MIISKNVSFEGQFKNFFILWKTHVQFLTHSILSDTDIKMGHSIFLIYFDKKSFCTLIAFFMSIIEGKFFFDLFHIMK